MTRAIWERCGARFPTGNELVLTKHALNQRRYRSQDPEHYRELNAKHQKAWRERQKQNH